MPPKYPVRHRPVHFPAVDRDSTGIIIFLTVATRRRKKILASSAIHDLLRKCWRDACFWRVGRYVILPDHVHLFCSPGQNPPSALKDWVGFWKRKATQRWPERSEVSPWQLNFWDTQLRKGDSYSAKWEYIRQNPVRHGYVERAEDWIYQGEIEVLPWKEV